MDTYDGALWLGEAPLGGCEAEGCPRTPRPVAEMMGNRPWDVELVAQVRVGGTRVLVRVTDRRWGEVRLTPAPADTSGRSR